MPAGSSFYLVLGFKVARGNGFRDSLSRLSQRGITDTQVTYLSLTFLTRCITTFVQPSARTVITFVNISAFMPVQAGQNLHECNSCLTGDETVILQERPCFFLNSTLHVRHVRVLFGLRGKSFFSLQYSILE